MSIKKARAPGRRWFDDVEKATAASRLAKGSRTANSVGSPALVVIRMGSGGHLFAWEVRRYTAIVLARGENYATEALARAAGERALLAVSAPSDMADL